jgi:hypothetical protein
LADLLHEEGDVDGLIARADAGDTHADKRSIELLEAEAEAGDGLL